LEFTNIPLVDPSLGEGIKGRVKPPLLNTPILALPPQGGGEYIPKAFGIRY